MAPWTRGCSEKPHIKSEGQANEKGVGTWGRQRKGKGDEGMDSPWRRNREFFRALLVTRIKVESVGTTGMDANKGDRDWHP